MKKETAKKLSTVIDMKPEEIEKNLVKRKLSKLNLDAKGTNLTYQDKLKIEKMNLPHILYCLKQNAFIQMAILHHT